MKLRSAFLAVCLGLTACKVSVEIDEQDTTQQPEPNTPPSDNPPVDNPTVPSVDAGAGKFAAAFAGKSLMGMNLGGDVYYSASQYYKDLMRAADPWKTADSTGTRWENDIYFSQIPKRADGYPTHVPFAVNGTNELQRVETPISAGSRDNTGLYHVFFAGSGEFDILGASLQQTPADGHRVYDFGTQVGADKILRISQSDIKDPIHAIQIIHEDDLASYQTQAFNDELKPSLADVSFVRLMDMMFTNGNAAESDENITPINYYTNNDCPGNVCDGSHFAGHPPQVLMQMVNHLDVHPWLTFGHKVDDDYIRAYAQIVLDTLDDDKYVILEYSNELWNWLFEQTHWLSQTACADSVARVELDNGECDGETSSRRYQTKRSLEIFNAFKQVFGGESHRVITVLAGQGSWAARTEMSLQALNDPAINPHNQSFDALAIAPYFGGDFHIADQVSRDYIVNSSFDELEDFAIEQIHSDEVKGGIEQHKQLANQYKMELIAYEGGQHFLCGAEFCDDQVLMTKLADFQRHQVMQNIYDEYYKVWFAAGGSIFAAFSHIGPADSKFGAWGTMEYYGQDINQTPKLRALQTASSTYSYQQPDFEQVPDPVPTPEPTPDPQPTPDPVDPTPDPVDPPQTGDKNLKTYIFGHSLILHLTETDETTVPHWMHQMAVHSGDSFSVSGQYGFLLQHANLPPNAQWGFDQVPGAWDQDTGDTFADVDFNTVLLTAANFAQYKAASEPYDGDNPEQKSPLSATTEIVDWLRTQEPGIQVYIYENWPDMGGTFPPSEQRLAEYHQQTLNEQAGGFHRWWLDYHDQLVQSRPDANVKMIPVGPVIAKLLTQTALKDIPVDDLYEDNSPHGRATIYYLASLVTYMAMYQQKAPSDFVVPDSIHQLVHDNHQSTIDFIWTELQQFNFASGSSRVW
ncbi:hypothetical protein [Catenovulum agarivorans]|uniref:hypothetical protein n=1 Tax=Catenovulum agarivorans TaxID=1172192 RepID=UPI0003181A0A|nr:hypothetical protein [Catenovulum agarivorans]